MLDLVVPSRAIRTRAWANVDSGRLVRLAAADGTAVMRTDPGVGQRAERVGFDDPAIVSKARELTAGSADSWEAVRRLAVWVSREIRYEIPGGGTARKTLDLRRCDCGPHARLMAALCRAVGIPAHMVTGGIYFLDNQGKFGQHGWNEVYLGETAGSIALDTTFGETDYVDSGYIWLGENCSFEPVSIEIIDYQLAPKP